MFLRIGRHQFRWSPDMTTSAQSALPYVVKKRGRSHAAFQYAADAQEYVRSEVATRCLGQSGVYGPDDYTIEEAMSGRLVIGVNGHGHALMEKLRKVDNAR